MNELNKLILTVALALSAPACFAYESHLVHSADGQPMLELRFFNVGDGAFMHGDPTPSESTWNLNEGQKGKVLEAMQYWADAIQPTAGFLPAVVNVGTYDVENAAGYSMVYGPGVVARTQLQAALQGYEPGPVFFGSQAQFLMGTFDFDNVPYIPAQLPPTGRVDMMSTALHELAHGLGMASSAYEMHGEGTPYFADQISTWTAHLRDDHGRPARAGQAILCGPCRNPYSPDAFDLRKDQGYFSGKHVDEVLAGSMPGVPVKILWEGGGGIDANYMSHSELKNSTMSHQSYGNYAGFMEAELAVMQDLGYHIDRRNFFGRSVYNDGLNIVNEHGYFQRNPQGSAYLPGTYNTATLGLGLHIYGSRNIIRQRADLLTQGRGGSGIRVDGRDNTVVIEPGVRIHADGLNGRGLAFAYGRDHILIQHGEVQAMGELGIAASFDFGSSTLGDDLEYRGSYLRRSNGAPAPLLDELDGPLVERYDLTGRLAGRQAAIYLSPNALVRHINVMRGASIQGDIVSRYEQVDDGGSPRLTQLGFGQLPDALGQATRQPDADFFLRYRGNIQGPNIALSAHGGHTFLNGRHDLNSVHVLPGATLAGDSHYILRPGNAFLNDGTVAPGSSLGRIDIVGDYRQGPQGELALEADGRGEHDILAVKGNAVLDGRLAIIPLRDWYPSNWNVRFDQLIQADTVAGGFASVVAEVNSPTLVFQVSEPGLNVVRPDQAYSRYARDANARQAGRALDHIAGIARADIQPLYQALDFSASDGSTVSDALEPLSGAAYSVLFAGALQREQQIADLVRRHAGGGPDSQWRGYAAPFGAGFRQQRRGDQLAYDASTYGAVFGIQTRRQDWSWGVYGALSEQDIKLRDPQQANGESTALHLGLQARYAPDRSAGPFVFGLGQAGVEQGKLERRLDIGQYQARHRADWTGYSGALAVAAGYNWALSPTASAGPVAALGYTYLHRPALSESGPDATRLDLRAASFSSLRASLGAGASLDLPLKNEAVLKARLLVAWEHELLNRQVTQQAAFAGYPHQGFSARNTVMGADALAVTAGLDYARNDRLAIGASISSQFLRTGYRSLAGNLALNWRF
ncbi:MAG: autotransporter outer membrane beta-barrel domain-containing protein [Pusillimonas sp.]